MFDGITFIYLANDDESLSLIVAVKNITADQIDQFERELKAKEISGYYDMELEAERTLMKMGLEWKFVCPRRFITFDF